MDPLSGNSEQLLSVRPPRAQAPRRPDVHTVRSACLVACIAVVSLAWTVLSCLILYMHWGDGDRMQCEWSFVRPCGWLTGELLAASLVLVLLCVNVITVILLPAL